MYHNAYKTLLDDADNIYLDAIEAKKYYWSDVRWQTQALFDASTAKSNFNSNDEK